MNDAFFSFIQQFIQFFVAKYSFKKIFIFFRGALFKFKISFIQNKAVLFIQKNYSFFLKVAYRTGLYSNNAPPRNLKEISLFKHLSSEETLKVWDPLPNQILMSGSVSAQGAQPKENRVNFAIWHHRVFFLTQFHWPQALILYPVFLFRIFECVPRCLQFPPFSVKHIFVQGMQNKSPWIKGTCILVYCLSHFCLTLFTKIAKNVHWLDKQ